MHIAIGMHVEGEWKPGKGDIKTNDDGKNEAIIEGGDIGMMSTYLQYYRRFFSCCAWEQ